MNPFFQAENVALQSMFQGAAVATAEPTGWIRITGNDRVRWLNGMVTNSVQALASGQGAYTFLLNAQGRIQGDGVIWAGDEVLFLQTSATQTAPLMDLLDRFIIMDEVELADASAGFFGIRLAGPQGAPLLQAMGIDAVGEPHAWRAATWMTHPVCVQSVASPLVPRYEVWATNTQVAQELRDSLLAQGAAQASGNDFETLRVMEGTPRFGVDIRDRDLPQETGQMRALHFSKGCYLGQEIVERIRSRGAVHRTFHAFELEGEVPAAGAALEADGKAVGELTSFAAVGGKRIALGYVRREVLDRGAVITYADGTAKPVETPMNLPPS